MRPARFDDAGARARARATQALTPRTPSLVNGVTHQQSGDPGEPAKTLAASQDRRSLSWKSWSGAMVMSCASPPIPPPRQLSRARGMATPCGTQAPALRGAPGRLHHSAAPSPADPRARRTLPRATSTEQLLEVAVGSSSMVGHDGDAPASTTSAIADGRRQTAAPRNQEGAQVVPRTLSGALVVFFSHPTPLLIAAGVAGLGCLRAGEPVWAADFAGACAPCPVAAQDSGLRAAGCSPFPCRKRGAA